MDKTWIEKYPRAAAMLQRDEDVLLYAPQSAGGLDDPAPAAPLPWEALALDLDPEEMDRGDW